MIAIAFKDLLTLNILWLVVFRVVRSINFIQVREVLLEAVILEDNVNYPV